MQGQEFSTNTYFSDYKEFEGIMLPTKSTSELAPGMEAEANVEKYNINETLDEGMFDNLLEFHYLKNHSANRNGFFISFI